VSIVWATAKDNYPQLAIYLLERTADWLEGLSNV